MGNQASVGVIGELEEQRFTDVLEQGSARQASIIWRSTGLTVAYGHFGQDCGTPRDGAMGWRKSAA